MHTRPGGSHGEHKGTPGSGAWIDGNAGPLVCPISSNVPVDTVLVIVDVDLPIEKGFRGFIAADISRNTAAPFVCYDDKKCVSTRSRRVMRGKRLWCFLLLHVPICAAPFTLRVEAPLQIEAPLHVEAPLLVEAPIEGPIEAPIEGPI